MSRSYRAFVNGKEVSFYSGGKEIKQLWGGDTLIWQKESIPDTSVRYALRFIFKNGVYVKHPDASEGDPLILTSDEAGFYIWSNITPKKIAYHIRKAEKPDYLSRRAYEVAVGLTVKDSDLKYVMVAPYNARQGNIKGPAYGTWYRTEKGADGVYSWEGNYSYSYVIYVNGTSASSSAALLDDNVKTIRTTDGARYFYDLEKMKEWLLSDD